MTDIYTTSSLSFDVFGTANTIITTGLVGGQLDEVRFTRSVRFLQNFNVPQYSSILKNIPTEEVCCETCDDDETINVNELISTNTIFKRLGFNYNGDGIFDYGCETLAFIKSIPKLLPDWAYKDIANASVNGYLKNPVENVTRNIANVLVQIKNTANTNSLPQLALTANNAYANAMLYLNHTSRLSGNLVFDDATNLTYIPTFDSAISTGKLVSYLVYQADGCVTSATVLGNFTSILVEKDLINLYNNIKDLPNTVNSNTSNTIIYKVLEVNDFLYHRKKHDENFYANSKTILKEYDFLKSFINVDETENILISNYLATEKLRERDDKFNYIVMEDEETYIDVSPVEYDPCRPSQILVQKQKDCENLPACELTYTPYPSSLPPSLIEEEDVIPEICIDAELPANTCQPYQADYFPWFTYFQKDSTISNKNIYNELLNNGTSLNINLGGYESSWQGSDVFVYLFNQEDVDGGYFYFDSDELYLNLSDNTKRFPITKPTVFNNYLAVGGLVDGSQNPTPGHHVYPGVCSFSSNDSVIQAKNYGKPVICELWYSSNLDGDCNPNLHYCNYTFIGDKNGSNTSLPRILSFANPNSYIKKYQAGIFYSDANMNRLSDSDFIAGVSYIGDEFGGKLKILLKGHVIEELDIAESAKNMQGEIDCFYDNLMSYIGTGKSFVRSISVSTGTESISTGQFYPEYDNDGTIDTYHCKYAWIVDCHTEETLDGFIYWKPSMFYTINVDSLCKLDYVVPTYNPLLITNNNQNTSYVFLPGKTGEGNIVKSSSYYIDDLQNEISIAVKLKPINLYPDKEKNSWYFKNDSTIVSKWDTEYGTFVVQLFDSRIRFLIRVRDYVNPNSKSVKFYEVFSESFCDIIPNNTPWWIGVTRSGANVSFYTSSNGNSWQQLGASDILSGTYVNDNFSNPSDVYFRIGAHGTDKNGNNFTGRVYRVKIFNTLNSTFSGTPQIDFDPSYYDNATRTIGSQNNIDWYLTKNVFLKT